jgi:hypothetical protein
MKHNPFDATIIKCCCYILELNRSIKSKLAISGLCHFLHSVSHMLQVFYPLKWRSAKVRGTNTCFYSSFNKNKQYKKLRRCLYIRLSKKLHTATAPTIFLWCILYATAQFLITLFLHTLLFHMRHKHKHIHAHTHTHTHTYMHQAQQEIKHYFASWRLHHRRSYTNGMLVSANFQLGSRLWPLVIEMKFYQQI